MTLTQSLFRERGGAYTGYRDPRKGRVPQATFTMASRNYQLVGSGHRMRRMAKLPFGEIDGRFVIGPQGFRLRGRMRRRSLLWAGFM